MIPCRHIACAIHSTHDVEEFQVNHLASRWHLKPHPFYIEEGIAAGIFKSTVKTIPQGEELEQDIQLYQNIQVPTQANVRYNNLFHLFKQLTEYSSNKHTYRVIYGQLVQLLNTVQQGSSNGGDSADTHNMVSLLPPPVVNSRTNTITSSANHGAVKKRTGGVLSQGGARKCRKCGLHGHRADNSSCPMYTSGSDLAEKCTSLDDTVHQKIQEE
jgi:Zinc knuckle